MQHESISVTLCYPDGAEASFQGCGVIVFTTATDSQRTFAVTGLLTLGDVAQLMNELMDTFGEDDISLAASLALVSRRMGPTIPEQDAD